MNLLVKKLGLVILPALFFACEEPTELGAPLNPNNGAVSTHYVEIPVKISQIRSDSMMTSLLGNVVNPYIGRVVSADFGTSKATLYTNVGIPIDLSSRFQSHDVFDYAELKLTLGVTKGFYGKNIASTQTFDVYQLKEPIKETNRRTVRDTIDVVSYRYYSGDKQELGDLIGQLSFELPDRTYSRDTVVSVRLEQGHQKFQDLFNAFLANTNDVRNSQKAFDEYFKGIALVPSENNSYLVNVDVLSAATSSGIHLHVNRGTDTYTVRLPFFPKEYPSNDDTLAYQHLPTYFGYETDRAGTSLANASNYTHHQEFSPTDDRFYLNSLAGIFPKVNYREGFMNFINSLGPDEHIVLNRAVLEFDSLLAEDTKMPIPSATDLFYVNNNNKFVFSSQLQGFDGASSTLYRSYKVGEKTIYYFQSDLAYGLDRWRQTGAEHFLQALLYPRNTIVYTPNSFVIRADQVKLKIWYTKLKGSNL